MVAATGLAAPINRINNNRTDKQNTTVQSGKETTFDYRWMRRKGHTKLLCNVVERAERSAAAAGNRVAR